jgi:hypothetical protein
VRVSLMPELVVGLRSRPSAKSEGSIVETLVLAFTPP